MSKRKFVVGDLVQFHSGVTVAVVRRSNDYSYECIVTHGNDDYSRGRTMHMSDILLYAGTVLNHDGADD
jgi:hypothetical protein